MSNGNMAIVCMSSGCERFRVICYGKPWHHRCRACEGPMKRARPADTAMPPGRPVLPPDLQAWREHGRRMVSLLPEPTKEDTRAVAGLLREMGADDLQGEPISLAPEEQA